MRTCTFIMVAFAAILFALPAAAQGIYLSDAVNNTIYRANLDGSGLSPIMTGLGGPWALAIDSQAGKIYWTESSADKIRRANLDGTEPEDLITTGLSIPRDLVLDVDNNKMYWADAGTDKIESANLDGSGRADVLTGVDGAAGLALDAQNGVLYYSAVIADVVGRVNVNGTGQDTLLDSSDGVDNPSSVVFDADNQRAYAVSLGTGQLFRVDADGDNEAVISNLITGGAWSLFFESFTRQIFIADGSEDRIMVLPLSGGAPGDLLTNVAGTLRDVAVIPAVDPGCSVVDNGNGTATVTCGGNQVVIADGTDGIDGEDAADQLIETQPLAGGALCPSGGHKVESGLDNGDGGGVAGDGELQPGEIDNTITLCNGADGIDGENGLDGTDAVSTLVNVNPIAPGNICAQGGQEIHAGQDNGDGGGIEGDGILQDGEVDSTTYVCDGTDGTDGIDGEEGNSCFVVDNNNGTYTLYCTDGSVVTLQDGDDGPEGPPGQDGAPGQDGQDSCALQENSDGTATITCGADSFVIQGRNTKDGAGNATFQDEGCSQFGDSAASLGLGALFLLLLRRRRRVPGKDGFGRAA
jgi:hypothetical protein